MKDNLKTLQDNFSLAILQTDLHTLDYKNSVYFSGSELMKVYQNAYQDRFINSLKASYSAVCRLVGDDFFAFLANKYLQENPPQKGCLQHYGHYFSKFLSTVKECENLPYLLDLANLERYYEQCYHGSNSIYNYSDINNMNPSNDKYIKSIRVSYLLSSKYPILDIWRLTNNSPTLNINKGGDNVLLFKYSDKITVMRLSQSNFYFLTKFKNQSK